MPLRSDWSEATCPIARSLDVVGDPWVLLLLREAVQGVDRAGWNPVAKPAVSSRTRWWAAAAAIVLSVGAGFVAGQRTLAATPPDVAIETAIEVPAAPAAPQPTRTISLQPGVNWTDVPGGK